MKKAFTFFLFLMLGMTAYSQIVINEISYNPPESNTDSLEFIEFYNSGGSMVDVSGWTVSGVTDTFPNSTTIAAGAYFVIAVNSDAMTNVFGVSTRQWIGGGLSNSGEHIVLRDDAGAVMDSVDYDDANGWDILPDGNGPSLELCLTADDNNIAENWAASTNATGVIINGMEVKGTPGAVNTVACPPSADQFVTVQSNFFSPADITINVGETVQWDNLGGFHNINGTTTTYPSNPEGFTNGGASTDAWSYSYTFNTAGFYNYQCDPHVGLGMTGTVTVVEPTVADLVITEIMYNNPGNDDFEFIEIYNNGAQAENLDGYLFSAGVTHTFGDVTIDPGTYLVVALNSDNMLNNFGVSSEQWNSGGLNNGGELITLVDANGNIVDEVEYDDGNGWPEICDGEGPSIILCDINSDNNVGANWSFSITNTGVNYGFLGNTIFASPGFANSSCAAAPYIFVDGTAITVNEGDGTVFVEVDMANINAMDTTDVTFTVNGSSTATDIDDYSIATLTFGIGGDGIGSNTSGTLMIDIVDDAVEEGSETIDLSLTMATNGVVIATSDFTVTISDNDGLVYPEYDISTVTTNDADGVADSLGVIAQIQGIVHGGDFSGGGSIQFTMIDATGGIGLFSGPNFGYTVTEGDEVVVQGTISQFNGLTQITPDTVWMVSANNSLVIPPVVTTLDESTESELIRINGVSIVDPSDWTGAGSGFNVDITDGTNNYVMRIDNDVDLYSESAPVGTFDVIGIGGQFDSSVPHNSGYQILPRYIPDIILDPGQGLNAVDDVASTDINMAINIEVLNNDNTPNGIVSLVIDQDASNGMTNIEVDNSITYTPNMDFCGTDNFTYIICENAITCDTATVTIEVICPSVYSQYPIVQVTTSDQNGVADSLGALVELTGIVYGVDLQGNDAIQFTMIDKNDPEGGISSFSGNNFGYTVNEGDELIVQGTISQFNGLTQITPDTLWMVSSGNSLHAPEVVTSMGESTESKLIKFENMSFVDPSDWDGSGSSFNIDITDGVNTFSMRIDNDVDLASMTVPPFAMFNVTGIGGQFDSTDPFDSGYQILPRYMEDIEEVLSVVDPTISEKVNYYPNPVHETLFVNMTERMDHLLIQNILGQQLISIDNPESTENINVSDLPEGIYILTFVNGNSIWSTEFVKQ